LLEIISSKNAKSHAISAFKMAMMNYDEELFLNTYNWLIAEKSFGDLSPGLYSFIGRVGFVMA
jgi:hypothetical protein